jgi:hypothetical protein
MERKKKFKICQRAFTASELEGIQNFVIKKLEVKDLFKLRDRFEGNQYLLNTIKRVFAFHTLFGHLEITNYEKIKLGFLNTFNFEEVIGKNIQYVEIENEINDLTLQNDTIYIVSNINGKKCTIYADNFDSILIAEKIEKCLLNFNGAIFN